MTILKVSPYPNNEGLEATWLEDDVQVWCQSYHPTQMQMFRDKAAEYFTSLFEYEDLIHSIESSYTPPAPPPPEIPQTITALQGLLVIDQFGFSEAYDAWSTSSARTFAEKAFINKALVWKRDDPTLTTAANALGLSSAQVDTMFIAAAQL